nr:bifunctional diguanylate cyclase/phosphodiesterase [Actibacterium sp. 188UL27-1]
MNRRAQRLSRKAELDALTQVENKAAFERKVRQRMADRKRPAALLALDLDYFKQVNDIYGHQFGDVYLLTLAETLRTNLPEKAIIGRTGGDEFCVLLDMPETGRNYLNTILLGLRTAIQRNVAVLGKPDLGRVSIGVSLFPQQATRYDQLLEQADIALYSSKGVERNTTTIFSSELSNLVYSRDSRSVAPAALDFQKITPHFQPIIDFSNGTCDGIEVLARWEDPDHGVMGPEQFYWMFRDHRLASKLTLHIVERAFQQLAEAQKTGWNGAPDLWINVTSHDLLAPEFVFDLQTILTEFGVSWDSIVVEVSEGSMLGERSGQLSRSLEEMRRRGARVALDDFGTGYAGLTHIRDWPVDIIKIDRTFVEQIADDESAQVVVQAVIMIAKTMSQRVVAEGIETHAQLSTVLELGCNFGQGFLLSPALSAEDLSVCPQMFDLDNLPGLIGDDI